jgi:hypothetical protein
MPTPAPPLGTDTDSVADVPSLFGVDDPPQATNVKFGGDVAVMV